MSGNLEMLRPGIQMITRRERRKAHRKQNTNPNTRTSWSICHNPDVIQSSNPVHTDKKNGRWAGSRDLCQCMSIVVLQATTHPSCRSHHPSATLVVLH